MYDLLSFFCFGGYGFCCAAFGVVAGEVLRQRSGKPSASVPAPHVRRVPTEWAES